MLVRIHITFQATVGMSTEYKKAAFHSCLAVDSQEPSYIYIEVTGRNRIFLSLKQIKIKHATLVNNQKVKFHSLKSIRQRPNA